jgi:leucyl/phenylalanyl-tRNA---protein transferase
MVEAYNRWHRLGFVHSFETWIGGELVGGLYGVGLGRMFYGESMFARQTDASKIALAALVAFCREHRMPLIDCQQQSRHLASLGANPWPRAQFEAALAAQTEQEPVQNWVYHPALWRHLELGDA